MDSARLVFKLSAYLFILIFWSSCTPASPTPQQALVTPSPTSIPPTPTIACSLECAIDTQGYAIEITCESGQITTTFHDSTNFEGQTIKSNLDQIRVYENSGNEYQIVGEIYVDEAKSEVSYSITVTGGVFSETPQTCEK